MKITVYTLATDDDGGTGCHVFTTENQRDDALLNWAGTSRDDWQKSDLADDLHEYVQSFADYLDTFSADQHELILDSAEFITVSEAWKTCKDVPGSFGNLYDPNEIMTMLDGYEDEGEKDNPDGRYYDPSNSEDQAAMLAWCLQEGPAFEKSISELVWTNLPTRREAYEALQKKKYAEIKSEQLNAIPPL